MPLHILSETGIWAMLSALIGPGVLWFLIARRLAKFPLSTRAAASILLRTLGTYLACWASTIVLALWDPIRAFNWMAD
jgi:hypothetical protein